MNTNVNVERKEINCDVFIVPNEAIRFNADIEESWGFKTSYGERVSKLAYYQDRVSRFFKDLNYEKNDRCVQTWVCSGNPEDKDSNWTDHPGEFLKAMGLALNLEEVVEDKELRRYMYIPKFLPSHIFAGKKEGDIITLKTHNDITLKIRLKQLDYRYRERGPFEKVLHQLGCE